MRAFALFCLLAVGTLHVCLSSPLPPVIFVPGSPTSLLEVTLTNPTVPSGCPSSGKFLAYPNDTFQALQQGRCFEAILGLEYDTTTQTIRNATGVEVRVVEAFDVIDAWPLLSGLHSAKLPYVFGYDFIVITYDWRLSSNLDTVFLAKYAAAVEGAYAMFGTRVHLIAHSTGPGMVLHFLNAQTQAWKDQYVASFIPLSGNFAGEVDITTDLIDATKESFDFVATEVSQQFWWTQPAEAWQMPHPAVYGSRVIVQTPSVSYTAADLAAMLKIVKATPMLSWYNSHPEFYNTTWALDAPQVDTYCLYGSNLTTVVSYRWANDDFSGPPEEVLGEGDGEQDILTNSSCEKWAAETTPPHTFYSQAFPGVEHVEMITSADVMQVIAAVLTGRPPV